MGCTLCQITTLFKLAQSHRPSNIRKQRCRHDPLRTFGCDRDRIRGSDMVADHWIHAPIVVSKRETLGCVEEADEDVHRPVLPDRALFTYVGVREQCARQCWIRQESQDGMHFGHATSRRCSFDTVDVVHAFPVLHPCHLWPP